MTTAEKNKAKNAVNGDLFYLGKRYHNFIPNAEIDKILTLRGLNALEEGIYCGREGHVHEHVGEGLWLSMTWYKMSTGRYEIVAYVN